MLSLCLKHGSPKLRPTLHPSCSPKSRRGNRRRHCSKSSMLLTLSSGSGTASFLGLRVRSDHGSPREGPLQQQQVQPEVRLPLHASWKPLPPSPVPLTPCKPYATMCQLPQKPSSIHDNIIYHFLYLFLFFPPLLQSMVTSMVLDCSSIVTFFLFRQQDVDRRGSSRADRV